jgi:hypothetical protein
MRVTLPILKMSSGIHGSMECSRQHKRQIPTVLPGSKAWLLLLAGAVRICVRRQRSHLVLISVQEDEMLNLHFRRAPLE